MSLPSDQELIAYIERENAVRSQAVTRRDIAKAFGVKGPARAELRRQLKRLESEGRVDLDGKKARRPGQLPPVGVMVAEKSDREGDLICRLENDETGARIVLPAREAAKARPPIGVGGRFLGKLREARGEITASVIKPLSRPEGKLLGIFRKTPDGGLVEPVSRKNKTSLIIGADDRLEAEDGDLVWAEARSQRGYGPKRGRITQVVGSIEETKNLSLIALAEHDIRTEFPPGVISEAESLSFDPSDKHIDLTALPLVTIDPAGARDHDDAVHAEKTDSGFRLTVAIADVSYYVRPGSHLDREAEKRGNSVYLPDRVVPMLPERLSNDLCSLKEGEERLALCCEIEIGTGGGKKSHRFFRATIKNHQNLAYERAQAIADGEAEGPGEVHTLFEAYRALVKARERRRPLDLDMAERRILMEEGAITGIERKERMDAHRLIEEFMVLANVCAAETLKENDRTAIYRVHDAPDPERLDGLRVYLDGLGYSLPKADEVRAFNLNGVLQQARERDEFDIIAMSVLRSQSQAIYDTENIGHFGLSLKRYAHFTSPIRRYADLTVHRGLVRALGLGPGGERPDDEERLDTVAETISQTERRAIQAERDTEARLLSAYLEEQVGADFEGRIGGVTRAGLFVTLNETGADGFVPIRTLGWEFFEHDEKRNALVSERSGGSFTMGMPVKVRLLEAVPVQGGLLFEMLTKPQGGRDKPASGRKPAGKAKAPAKGDRADKEQKGSTRHGKAKSAAKRAAKGRKAAHPTAERSPKTREPQEAAPKKLVRRPKKKR
jgi:ribonuclease R